MRYCSQCAHLIVSFIALASLAVRRTPPPPLRQVRVFEANVSSQAEPAVQAQSGLRVRCWCAPLARAMPPMIRRSRPCSRRRRHYVIATRPAATGSGTTLVFDAAALERDIVAAGRTRLEQRTAAAADRAHGRPRRGCIRNPSPGRRRARCRGQSPRPADLVSRVPKALSLPTTGDIPVEAALAAAQRLRRRRSTRGLRRRRSQWWRLALDAERRRASANPGMARSKKACMARPMYSRAMRVPVCGAARAHHPGRSRRRAHAQGLRARRGDARRSRRRSQRAARRSCPASRATFCGADARRRRCVAGLARRQRAASNGWIRRRVARSHFACASKSLDVAPSSQSHLPGAHRADLADHRRAVRRPNTGRR